MSSLHFRKLLPPNLNLHVEVSHVCSLSASGSLVYCFGIRLCCITVKYKFHVIVLNGTGK